MYILKYRYIWLTKARRGAIIKYIFLEDITMSNMNIVCLDLEGVLVPEIWIAFK